MKTTHLIRNASMLSLASLLIGTGCPDEEPSNGQTTTQDMAEDDMPLDMPVIDADMGTPDLGDDMPVDMEVCEPLTECPVDTCGTIEDTCGGTVDCGACACVDGQPTEATCGVCGFGVAGCESAAGDGPATCGLEALTVTPSDCDTIVYVREADPVANPDGSKANPYSDFAQAFAAGKANGASMLAVAQGSYNVGGVITLVEGMHIVGGFTNDFVYDEEGSSSLTITPTGQGDERVGMEAFDVEEKTWLKQLDLTVEGVNAPFTLYGMHIVGSPALHLEEVSVTTGPLGDGSSGKDGADGADGGDGGDAEVLVTLASRVGDMTVDGYENGASAGAAGVNPDCAAVANGGAGGEGIHILATELAVSPFVEYMRVLPDNGATSEFGTPGGTHGTSVSPAGMNGMSGIPGTGGNNGASGVSQGSVVCTYWSVEGNGADGEDGGSGTGGSGGGGTWWMEEAMELQESKPGASGGGGGAGGCGGEGGLGGQAGASGFGILVVDSMNVVFERVSVQGPDAGNGGNAGSAGEGGVGGRGGDASSQYATQSTSTPQAHPLNAGRGGTAGQGSPGGIGGAGAGGSSFGVYCDSASSVMRMGEVSALAGVGGVGGVLASLPGENGQAEDVVNCW